MGTIEQDGGALALTDGLWCNASGVSLYIDESRFAEEGAEHSPYIALMDHAQLLIQNYPPIQDWVDDNPFDDDEQDATMWWKGFGRAAIECGWHLLWRGDFYTMLEEVDMAVRLLAQCPENVLRLAWPADLQIEVCVLSGKPDTFHRVDWQQVLSRL